MARSLAFMASFFACYSLLPCIALAAEPGASDAPEQAVRALENAGGKVVRDEALPGKPVAGVDFTNDRHVTDDTLAQLERFPFLRSLKLYRPGISDAGLRHLAKLSELNELRLDGANAITDAGVKELRGLKKLTALGLGGCKVTRSGLDELATLPELRVLDLSGSVVHAAGLKALANVPSLRELRMDCNGSLTDADMVEVGRLARLEVLVIGSLQVTDVGLKELTNLKNLRSLTLFFSRVTGTGLRELKALEHLESLTLAQIERLRDDDLKGVAQLGNLRWLSVSGCQITDAGIAELRVLTSLKRLDVGGTHATPGGLAGLKAALPGTEVLGSV